MPLSRSVHHGSVRDTVGCRSLKTNRLWPTIRLSISSHAHNLLWGLLCGAMLALSGSAWAREGAAADDKPVWDVNNPQLPLKEIPIDVEAGTWMSLDISPDGTTLVFDLLGDIYSLPVEGGLARPLTSGVSWDMQPRFRPDGQEIAFVSDRGGGHNLWVMAKDGSGARAVTKEDFRLISNPAYRPDANYLVGRKHFTGRRSLGAGEIWMVHTSGGKGVALTTKKNDQKDLGEPVFSPDGTRLYFSHDVTAGDVFEYNRDPNQGIYAISVLDLESGRIDRVVGGPGGAVRPTPARDGKHLAYVRRNREKTELVLRELESGKDRVLTDILDRDMQETWAIFGVYPSMAFSPDSKTLYFWAQGRIHRIPVAGGVPEVVPFRVQGSRQIADAVRFPVEVAPQSFPVRMLRGVRTSPDRKHVVYDALGYLWTRRLPDGPAVRLTSQTDHFEMNPSYSRDGKWIVYTTHDDRELGTVRIVPSTGGIGRKLTSTPGHFVDPVFSPDGKTIVVNKVSGGGVISPLYSHDPGLYAILVDGGTMNLVTRDGSAPGFGASSDRVYFAGTDGDKRALKSIGIDGLDPRTHVTSASGVDYAVSPDEQWVAFNDRFRIVVAALPKVGRPLEYAIDSKSLPIARVAQDSGYFLHWSNDSKTLFWSLGPRLFQRDLAETFSFLNTNKESAEPEVNEGIPIGLDAVADKPKGIKAIVGARVIPMVGDTVMESATIVIEGDRIVAIGTAADVVVPKGAWVLSAEGKTIIPGLVDVHAHSSQGQKGIIPEQNWQNYGTLAFGVTTVHDPSNDTETFFAASEMAKVGTIVAPRLFSTGTLLYGADTEYKSEVDSLEDARSHLRRLKASGAFSVKSYNQPRRDQRQMILAAARELGMMVVPEGGSVLENNLNQIVDGHTTMEHALPAVPLYEDVLQLWSASGVGYTPTLGVAYGGLFGEGYWYQESPVWDDKRLMTYVPRFAVDPKARRPQTAPLSDWNHIAVAKSAKQLRDRGVRVHIGAHGQREGLAAHWEMWMLHQGGFSPMQALRAATLDGATSLGMNQHIGSIEVGKLADLVVLNHNPLDDLRHSRDIETVVLGGRFYDAKTMDELGAKGKKRAPFFWESDTGAVMGTSGETIHHQCVGCEK